MTRPGAHSTTAMAPSLVRVLAQRHLRLASGAALVAWAIDALVDGQDSPALRILAGLACPPNEFELDSILEAYCRERGWPLPGRSDLVASYCRLLAEDIVEGRLPPDEGARSLYRIWIAEEDPEYLSTEWVSCDDAFDLARSGMYGTVEEAAERTIAEARRMLGLS